jgi:DNA anti-recombination protein RmuC
VFLNSALSLFNYEFAQEALSSTPVGIHPALKRLKRMFKTVSDQDNIKEISKILVNLLFDIFESMGINDVIQEIINYVLFNKDPDEVSQEDEKL